MYYEPILANIGMRVYDTNLTPTSGAEAAHSQETQKAGRAGQMQTSRVGSASGDHVELSGALGRLSQTISAFHQDRARRVEALAAEYQGGRYRPDSTATSRAMVSEALAAGLK
jgi:anti-sigma28 factor (negative regulator of flagellin synthesis)